MKVEDALERLEELEREQQVLVEFIQELSMITEIDNVEDLLTLGTKKSDEDVFWIDVSTEDVLDEAIRESHKHQTCRYLLNRFYEVENKKRRIRKAEVREGEIY